MVCSEAFTTILSPLSIDVGSPVSDKQRATDAHLLIASARGLDKPQTAQTNPMFELYIAAIMEGNTKGTYHADTRMKVTEKVIPRAIA